MVDAFIYIIYDVIRLSSKYHIAVKRIKFELIIINAMLKYLIKLASVGCEP